MHNIMENKHPTILVTAFINIISIAKTLKGSHRISMLMSTMFTKGRNNQNMAVVIVAMSWKPP